MKKNDRKFHECSCGECKKMCERTPCWPIPGDIEKLFETKYIKKFRLICFEVGDGVNPMRKDVDMPLPITKRKESYYHGECIFSDKDGLCILHNEGLKPYGGKAAIHEDDQPDIRPDILREWNRKEGRAIIKKFKELND